MSKLQDIEERLELARKAACSAYWAANSAAYSANSAAYSTARLAANSAYWAAYWAAYYPVEKKKQVKIIKEILNEKGI